MNEDNVEYEVVRAAQTINFRGDSSITHTGINELLNLPEHYASLVTRINSCAEAWHKPLKDLDGGAEILAMKPAEQRDFILAVIEWLQSPGVNNGWFRIRRSLEELLNRKMDFSHDEVLKILSWSINQQNNYQRNPAQMIKIITNYLKQHPLTQELQKKITELADAINADYATADRRKQAAKLREIAGAAKVKLPLVAGEAWTDTAIIEIESFDGEKRAAWLELLNECQLASGGQPSAKWLKTAKALFAKIGFADFKKSLLRWFALVDKPRTARIASWSQYSPDPNEMLDDVNADVLKGLVWLCAEREDKEMARALTALAISAYRKVALAGPRCVRVGNACVWALGAMPGAEGVSQLALLKLKVKFGSAQKIVEKALNAAAARTGLSTSEIEEMSVPAYGLSEVGKRVEKFGDCTAELVISGTNAAEIRWFNSAGKQQKSVPAAVKQNHAEELKELTNAAKDIKKMLPAQRDRLENLYLEEKSWAYHVWRERYLEHPLLGTLARRLIWRFSRAEKIETAIWLDGKLSNSAECEVSWIDAETTVELWHPLHSATEEVLEWRDFLQQNEIRQPFKQAHREIYLLTDAERNTRVYSNRFAAHVIKQHQFNALCEQRGWKNALWIMADMEAPPAARSVAQHNLRADFMTEPLGDNYETDITQSGAYLYLTTDQVRFYPLNAGNYWSRYQAANVEQHFAPVPLEQIPPLVFSEVMRDVDLFVGVASVGNDPSWADGGAENRYRDYWNSYSFGDLTETAKTRREVLAKIIPRLKIAAQCELSDRFLFVRGQIRTYKIHLGSGNILMSPNDQYLCIVPSSGNEIKNGRVFLPFEGDRTLAVILSKAFMLAEDEKITDPTITRQIKI